MTPRERARIGCKTLTVSSPGSLLEEDILTNMIESAESEARFAEREECAKLAETWVERCGKTTNTPYIDRAIAAEIRERKP